MRVRRHHPRPARRPKDENLRALLLPPASRVAPIDKLSLPLTIVLAALFLGESVGWRLGLGVALMTIGAILTIGG